MTTERLLLELQAKVDKYRDEIKKAHKTTEDFERSSEKSFKKVEKNTTLADKAMSKFNLSVAAIAVSVGIAARQFAVLADEYTIIERQIKRSETTQEGFNDKLGKLTDIAMGLGASLKDVTALYARLRFATEELGLSDEKVLQLTETLNKAFKASGSTAEEAASATLQLSQALASGVLQGDEFRAVSESAPIVMRALAKELNVTTGELKKMSSEGKITSKVLTDAILKSAQSVNSEYQRTAGESRTVSEGFNNLKTGATLLAGAIDDATGLTQGFSDALTFLGEVMAGLSGKSDGVGASVGRWLSGDAAGEGGLIKVIADIQGEHDSLSNKLSLGIKAVSTAVSDGVQLASGGSAKAFSSYTKLIEKVVEYSNEAEDATKETNELKQALIEIGALPPINLFNGQDENTRTPLLLPEPKAEVSTQPKPKKETDPRLARIQQQAEARLELLRKFKEIESQIESGAEGERIADIRKSTEARLQATQERYDAQIEALKAAGESTTTVEKAKNADLELIEKESQERIDKIRDDALEKEKERQQLENELLNMKKDRAMERVDSIIKASEIETGLFSSDLENLRAKHEAEQNELDRFLEKKLISEQDYIKASEALKKTQTRNEMQLTKQTFDSVLSQAASGNKKLFEINKIYSASKAAMKIPEIAQDSYAFGASFGGPVGGAAMAAIGVAAGIANLQSILSSSYGSTSAKSSSGSGGGAIGTTAPESPQQEQPAEIGVSISDVSDGTINTQRLIITTDSGQDIFDGISTAVQESQNDGRS